MGYNILSYRIEKKVKEGITGGERVYFDFMIDDVSLSEILNINEWGMIGALLKATPATYSLEKLEELMFKRKSILQNERVLMYGCAECLDIGCGAITAEMNRFNEQVTWKAFAYENGYEATDFEEYHKVGPFEFEASQYFETLERLKKEM